MAIVGYTNKHKHVCSGKSDSWRIVFSYFQSGRFPDGSSDSMKQIIGNKRKNYILTKEDFRVQWIINPIIDPISVDNTGLAKTSFFQDEL